MVDEGENAREEVTPPGLEHAPLGIAERAQVGSEEVLDSLLDGVKPSLDLPGRSSQG
jgi:hypothetical protein